METLSPSRITKMLKCNRSHYLAYEIGLQQIETAQALRFGSAFHRALAARATGAGFDAALVAGIGECADINELDVVILSALLAGYYARYADETIVKLFPEVQIEIAMPYNRHFTAIHVVDGLAELRDGRTALVEHKTCSESLADDSDYWQSLRFQVQPLAYVSAAREKGWDVSTLLWDAIRKPSIAPKQILILDEAGKKIVLDAAGNRVFKKDGEPRESGDTEKGYVVQSAEETPEQFGERLAADIAERPEFYYARRELAILQDTLDEFKAMRDCVARQIVSCRKEQARYEKPENAWPRNVGKFSCQTCDFSSFCLQNISASRTAIPSGFKVKSTETERGGAK